MKTWNSSIFMLLIVCLPTLSWASDLVYAIKKDQSELTVGQWLELSDGHGNALNTSSNKMYRSAQVHLVYNRSNHTDVQGAYWGYEIDYEITYWDAANNPQIKRDTLVISHDEDEGQYEAMKHYDNIPKDRAVVIVKGIRARQGNGSWGTNTSFIPADIHLELQLHVNQYFELWATPLQQTHQYTNTSSAHSLDIRWNHMQGQESTELEYVFWDSENTGSAPIHDPKALFANATRVETHLQHYELQLTYPAGTLYYRVRPVGYYVNGLSSDFEEHRRVGSWSTAGVQALSPFEEDKNWQYTSSFAEDGKSKKVIQYFDGSMRSRQSITFLNDEKKSLVAETDYSVEGQSMISIVPVPSVANNLFFKPSFNQNAAGNSYGYKDFDKAGGADALNTSTGAGQYYSSNNPFTGSIHRDYIADAGGYPMTQMRYTRDNTGRVQKQGGMGAFYQLGTDRVQEFHYGSVSDTELRRLFGSNVGEAKHYKKILAIDPNGQGTLSYKDMSGNTIATTLAGTTPDNVLELSSAQTTTITENLMSANQIDMVSDESSLQYGLLNTIRNNVYTFNYDLTGTYNSLTLNGVDICKACTYELEITVLDPDGLYLLPSSPPTHAQIDSVTVNGKKIYKIIQTFTGSQLASCAAGTAYSTNPISFSMLFSKIGEYRVSKTLRLAAGSLSMQQQCLDSLGVLPDSTVFVDSMIAQIDSTECDWYGTNDSIISAVLQWSSQAECNSLLTQMEYQVRALAGIPITSIVDATCMQNSVYKIKDVNGNEVDVAFNALGNMVLAGTSTLVSLDVAGTDGSVMTGINDITTFITAVDDPLYYQEEWTAVLVLCHREYCHYQECLNQINSNVFSLELGRYQTWAEFTADYPAVSYPNAVGVYNLDPFHLIDNCNLDDSLQTWTTSFYSGPLVQYIDTVIAYMNQSPNYNGNMTSAQQDTLRWKLFHSMYNAKKEELLISCSPCTFYDDSVAIVTPPSLPDPNDTTAVDSAMLAQLNGQCASLCPAKINIWMQDIANLLASCNQVLSASDEQAIRAHLEAYCMQSCGVGNPMAVLLQEDYNSGAYPSLNAAIDIIQQNYLNAPACSGVSVNTLFTNFNQVYTYAVDSLGDTIYTTMTVPFHSYFDDFCYQDIVSTLNQALQYPNIPSNDPSFVMNIPCLDIAQTTVDFFFYDQFGIFGIEPAGDCNFRFNLYEDASCVNNYTTLWQDITSVTYEGLVQANPCWTGPLMSTDFAKIAVHKNNNVIDTAYIHVYLELFCQDLTITTPVVVPKLDSNMTIDYNLDSAGCIQFLVQTAINQGIDHWQAYIDSLLTIYNNSLNNCWNTPFAEQFNVTYQSSQHHYTLYYYDQAGSLVQTIPPFGVEPLDDTHFDAQGNWDQTEPIHQGYHLATKYQYNALGQITTQNTPDAGTTVMYYDDVQRLRLAQNAQQALDDKYSYTKYDGQNRIVEVGQLENFAAVPSMAQLNDVNFPSVSTYTLRQRTLTTYDERAGAFYDKSNLRGRIAQVENEHVTTTYDYDVLGNVKHLKHAINNFESFDINYAYDLVSGNVNQVSYQAGKVDAFYHKYSYDADNRLQLVESSNDGHLWSREARYLYYLHGPLARVELGEGIQGLDYYYSLQGWIMGVNMPHHEGGRNSLSVRSNDQGKDGQVSSNNLNKYTAIDAYAYGLGYHEQAYSPINSSVSLGALSNAWTEMDNDILNHGNGINGLFNGNIAFMIRQVPELGKTLAPSDVLASQYALMGTAYQYDQLHRIRQSRSYAYTEQPGSNYTWLADNKYNTAYDYDGNGNIKLLNRKANGATIDNLSYTYKSNSLGQPMHNKLLKIADIAGTTPGMGDVQDQNALWENYRYDAIGNLTQDSTEGIANIVWNIQGKVERVEFLASTGKPTMHYTYDALGNRLSKTVQGQKTTYYIRDAGGNILSIYEHRLELGKNPRIVTEQKETIIYGLTRLGTKKCTQVIKIDYGSGNTYITERNCINRRGDKQYELSNHLGNVLGLVTDKKAGQDTNSDGQADYYTSSIVNAQLYYAYGWNIPGRQINPDKTRFGFNTQEKSPEISNGHTTALFWEYDSRSARRWNVDPRPNPSISPYNVFGGNPIYNTDPLGDTLREPNGDKSMNNPNSDLPTIMSNITARLKAAKTKLVQYRGDLAKENKRRKPRKKITDPLNTKIAYWDRTEKEMTDALQEIQDLDASPIDFVLDNTCSTCGGTGFQGLLELDVNTFQVMIRYQPGLFSVAVHEMKHAHQALMGNWSFSPSNGKGGWLYDLGDEVEAYQRQWAYDRKSLYGLTSFNQITPAWVNIKKQYNISAISLGVNSTRGDLHKGWNPIYPGYFMPSSGQSFSDKFTTIHNASKTLYIQNGHFYSPNASGSPTLVH